MNVFFYIFFFFAFQHDAIARRQAVPSYALYGSPSGVACAACLGLKTCLFFLFDVTQIAQGKTPYIYRHSKVL